MGVKVYNNRMIHYDLLRILACFAVIMIHSGIYKQTEGFSNQSSQILIYNLYGIISRWAVPCFVMISGIMFLDNNKEIPLKKLYGKYILRLFVSYVFWSCVYAGFNMMFETGDGFTNKLKYFINNCFSGEIHMWYVLMCIGLYIASPIIRVILNNASKRIIEYWITVMFIFASVIPFVVDCNIPYISGTIDYLNKYIDIQFLCGYTLYFVLGYYINHFEISKITEKVVYFLGVIGFIYSVTVLIILKYFINFQLGALNYFYPNIIFMGCANLVFFKYRVTKVHFSDKAKSVIYRISKLTYGIFLVHVLILKMIYHLGICLSLCNYIISIPLVTLITFIISMIVIILISKIPFINKYIC